MKQVTPKALIITAPGINCDLELCHAFTEAGADVRSELLQTLVRDPARIAGYDMIGLPGGFSFGDDIAAGRIMGALIARSIYPALLDATDLWPASAAQATVALANNAAGRFEDRWTAVEIPRDTVCVWTRGVQCQSPDDMLPNAHGEGRFVAPASVVTRLEAGGQVAIRYGANANFNGSAASIAGICDPSGLVFGLMPHPERFTRWTQHPQWTRVDAADRNRDPLGLRMFKSAVRWVREDRSGAHFELGASRG